MVMNIRRRSSSFSIAGNESASTGKVSEFPGSSAGSMSLRSSGKRGLRRWIEYKAP